MLSPQQLLSYTEALKLKRLLKGHTLALADERWPCARPTWHLAEGLPSRRAPESYSCGWPSRRALPETQSKALEGSSKPHEGLLGTWQPACSCLHQPTDCGSLYLAFKLAKWPVAGFRMPPRLLVSQRAAWTARTRALRPGHRPLAALPMELG